MLAIILSACLLNDPATCRDFKVPLNADIDITRCAMFAPPHFSQWANEHPGWQIKRWRCTAASEQDL